MSDPLQIEMNRTLLEGIKNLHTIVKIQTESIEGLLERIKSLEAKNKSAQSVIYSDTKDHRRF